MKKYSVTLFIMFGIDFAICMTPAVGGSPSLLLKQYKVLSAQAKSDVKYNIKARRFDAFKKTIGFSQFCVRFFSPLNIAATIATASVASASAYYNTDILRYITVGSSVANFATASFYEFFKKKLKHADTSLALQYAQDMVVEGHSINSIIEMLSNVDY